MPTILLVDDHPVVRKGLKQVIVEELDGAVVVEAETGQGAIETVLQQKLDVVVLDINLPDKNGLEVLKEMKAARPHLPIVVLSVQAEEHYAIRAFRAGATGYLTKGSAAHELVVAIKQALQGMKYVSATFAVLLADCLDGKADELLHRRLSDREYQVLTLLAGGTSITEIADRLALSTPTISTYRARLLEKLKLTTTAELIRYAIEHKLVE